MNLLHTAPLRASVALALLFNPVAHAQLQVFGDWSGSQSLDVYVDASAGAGGNGTLSNPFSSITGALETLETGGLLGVQDVTINVMGIGPYDELGDEPEAFPLAIPAHGVAIEAHFVGADLPRVGPSLGVSVASVIEVDSVGNSSLSPSVVRGLSLWNGYDDVNPNSVVRVDVPASAVTERIAPEFRDCVIDGEPFYGVELIGAAGIQNEALFERNVIEQVDIAFGEAGVRIEGSGGGVMAPLFRANEIFNYQVNVDIDGGGASNQSRFQSNVIRDGGTNVFIGNASPWILSNTIAAATTSSSLPGVGVEWTGPGPIGFMNNLLWNPTGPDVVGSLAIFENQPYERQALFNVDQDDRLFGSNLPWVTSPWPAGGQVDPFVDYSGRDFHLVPDSWVEGIGISTATIFQGPVLVADVPGLGQPTPIRWDLAWDMDFQGRQQGGGVEVGADAVTQASAATAALTLQFDPLAANPADALGNLRPDPAGNWITDVVIEGQAGDHFVLCATVVYDEQTDEAGPLVEDRFSYHHSIVPGLGTSFGLPFNYLLPFPTTTFTGSPERIALNLGAMDPNRVEAEVYLQVLSWGASSQGATSFSSERLVLELNR